MDQEFCLTDKFLTTHICTMNYSKNASQIKCKFLFIIAVLNTFKLTAFMVTLCGNNSITLDVLKNL